MRIETAFLFDLDGTLVDSVYQHVLAWKTALDSENIELSVWRIHRKIGMSGGLFTNQLLRETGFAMEPDRIERLRRAHAAAYQELGRQVRPLPGARELLAFLTDANIPWAIATSGRMETAAVNLAALGVDPKASPVVTRDEVRYAKPDPDLFLAAAAQRADRARGRGRRQHLGHACRDTLPGAWRRPLERRLWLGGAAPVRRHPRLRGSGRPARPHRRGRRPAVSPVPAIRQVCGPDSGMSRSARNTLA